jgi:hypothetical protein
MRSLLLAVLSMSCACACDESQRVAEARVPVAPAAPPSARSEPPPAPAASRSEPSPAALAAAPVVAAPAAPAVASPATPAVASPAAPAVATPAAPAVATPAAPAVALPATTAAVAAADPREATRRAAHDVLAQHCGECHESHRPTAKPKALAIFDLDQPDWPSRFDDHKYKSALKRLANQSDAARDTFIAFREAELAASSAKTN